VRPADAAGFVFLSGVEISMQNLDVIALGGNAILPAGKSGTIYEQFAITRVTMAQIAKLVGQGRNVVLTHGNGPIVGNIVLRNEAMRDTIPPMPLGICVADSQGGIGYMVQQVLRNALLDEGIPRDVVTLVTQVRISPNDPALEDPTKPIGPFYTGAEAKRLEKENQWKMIEDSNRGYRRVVPSPRPLEIVEVNVVRKLVDSGAIVVTVGGGGIPVVADKGRLDGVEAVVDKDYATAVLAKVLGASRMIVVTDIDAVYKNFGKKTAAPIARLTLDEAVSMLQSGQLPVGSMGSKIEAAVDFVSSTGNEAIITRPEDISLAIAGSAGTRITKD
jgi:carbamate kinase